MEGRPRVQSRIPLACLATLLLAGAALEPSEAAVITTHLVCTRAGVTQNAAAVMGANAKSHATESDYVWSSVQDVRLKSTLVISKAGTYRLHGTIANGQVVVKVNGNGVVRLILAGVTITSAKAAAISIVAAPKVVVVLKAGTVNTLSDGVTRSTTDAASAAIYSKAPLTITGSGALRVMGRHGDAIAGNDGVVITGGSISVNAQDDGIRGSDFVHITGGRISIKAASDGIRSTGKKASTVGYVYIGAGRVTVEAKASALHGLSDVVVAGGKLRLTAGGDGIESSCVSYIEKADVTIAAGTKAVHSNGETVVRGGSVRVSDALEGLEGRGVTISGGTLRLKTRDDGINVTARAAPVASAIYSNNVEERFEMSGGVVVIDARGDGLDVNGTATMTGGKLIVAGPVAAGDGALDTGDAFVISGGQIIGVGPSSFATAPTHDSPQASILGNLMAVQPAGSVLQIADASGRVLAGLKTIRAWQSVVFSSPQLANGQTYKVLLGGELLGTPIGGYYPSGSLSGARLIGTFTAGDYVNPPRLP